MTTSGYYLRRIFLFLLSIPPRRTPPKSLDLRVSEWFGRFLPCPIVKLLSFLMQTPFKTKILSTNGKHKLKVDISPFLFHTEVDLGTRNGDISYRNKGSEAEQRELRKRRLFKIRTKLGTVPSSLRTHRAPRYKITETQASKFPDQRCFSQWSTSCSNVYTRPNRKRN